MPVRKLAFEWSSRCGYGLACSVVASVRCSLPGVGFVFQTIAPDSEEFLLALAGCLTNLLLRWTRSWARPLPPLPLRSPGQAVGPVPNSGTFLIQKRLYPRENGSHVGWFRMLHICREVMPCWWNPITHEYQLVPPAQIKTTSWPRCGRSCAASPEPPR